MKQNKRSCDLKSCLLCRECMPSWLPAVDANRQCLHFKKGETLFREDERVEGMFFINTGIVKIHKHWNEDKELILRIAKDGDIVGHRGLGGDTIYPVTGTALEATDACFVNLNFFNDTLKVNANLLYNLMMFFAAELKESEKRMRNLAHMSVKGRVANALITLKNKFGIHAEGYIDLRLSRQDLASYTGTTYETLFRVLNELVEEQLVKTDGKTIFILNEQGLSGLAREK